MLRTFMVKSSLIALVGSISFAAHAMADAQRQVNVPAGDLLTALQSLARQSDVELIYKTELLKGLHTQGVSGALSPQEAVKKLLEGTRLQLRTDESTGAMVISPPPASAPVESSATSDNAALDVSNERQSGRDIAQPAAAGPRPSFWDRFRLAQADEGATRAGGAGSTADGGTAESGKGEVQEIVVTAQKRVERLIDAPQSVSVLSGAELSRMGASQFSDYAATVPGLSFTTSGAGANQISLRGVTMGLDASSTVALYVDEVPFGSSGPFVQVAQNALDVGLFDVERIEVLRGPQGTLYGASAMGGLIKYVTRRPEATEFNGGAQAGVSSTHEGGINFNFAAAANFPLVTDKLALRATGFETHDGGYIDNLARAAKDVNQSDIRGGRLDLLFTPSERASIRLTGFLQNITRDGDATADYSFSGQPLDGELDQRRRYAEPFDQRYRFVSATLAYDFDSVSVTSISSYQMMDMSYTADISASYVPLFQTAFGRSFGGVGYPVELGTDKFAQEVRVASRGAHRLEWQIGGFYTHEDTKNIQSFSFLDSAFQPVPSATNEFFYYVNPTTFEEYAAFGDVTWHLTDQFDVTGGLRRAHSTQGIEQTGLGAFVINRPATSASNDADTYLANARYRFTNHATGYLRFATGYRPGGPNFPVRDATTGESTGEASFAPDRLKSYEAGFRAESDDRHYSIDVAAYFIDWSNIQIQVIRGGFGALDNAPGGASIRGGEIAFTARPLDALSLVGSMAYQDAHMDAADPDLGAAAGERLPNVPRFTAALSADYTVPFGTLEPTFGATVRHVGERPVSFDASTSFPQYQLPEYTVVDVRGGVSLGSTTVQLYAHNLLDERGELGILLPQFGGRVALVQPRTIGLQLTTQF